MLVLFGFVRLTLAQCTTSAPSIPHCREGFRLECHTDTEDRCSGKFSVAKEGSKWRDVSCS